MKIGIDVDNTITTTFPILKRYCIKYNEEVIKRNLKLHEDGYSTMTLFDWTHKENLVFCNKYLREIVMQAPIKQNAKEVIGTNETPAIARVLDRFIKEIEEGR